MAEINFNNLYDQLSPMDKMFYDQQFQKSYNPNQENIMLSSQNAYEQMKSVYDAQQQVPEKSFFDSLNPFTSASAAEMPPVPNVSLGTPQINFNTGITGASNAIPMINSIPMINTGMIDQNLQNTDLVQQIIAENQARINPFVRPNILDITGAIVPGGITEITPSNMNLQKPNSLGFGTNYGVANTPDVIGDWTGSDVYEMDNGLAYVIDSKGNRIIAPQKAEYYKQKQKPSGIAKLFEFLGNIPTPINILRGGLESLSGLNQKLRSTDFGRSKTLQEYLQRREAGKDSERLQTVGQQLKQSSDRGGGYQPTSREQNVARTESRVSNGRSRAYGL
jgi:hypothetical protein